MVFGLLLFTFNWWILALEYGKLAINSQIFLNKESIYMELDKI